MTDKKQNQSEGEFFALVATGRKGVEDMLAKMGDEIARVSAPNVGGSFDVWKTRALVEIANRDELAPVLSSRAGIFSVYKALTKAATMGLQIGGVFPHAYFVPMEGKAQLVTTADGYAFASVHGPGAVLASVPKLERVHANDKCHIDASAGTVKHAFDPFGERGKIAGYYMRLEYRDGHVEIPHITRADVEKISNDYSKKEFSGGRKAPAWVKSAEAMYDKIASKQLLKKPVKEAEGLAMMLGAEDYEAPEYTPPPRDISDRMSERLDTAMRTVEPIEDDEQGPLDGIEIQPAGADDEENVF